VRSRSARRGHADGAWIVATQGRGHESRGVDTPR
jgi:hypothetical protein